MGYDSELLRETHHQAGKTEIINRTHPMRGVSIYFFPFLITWWFSLGRKSSYANMLFVNLTYNF